MIWLFLFLFVGTAQASDGAERIPRCFDLGDGQCSNIIIYQDAERGVVIEAEKPGCYQKIQEAMKSANTYIPVAKPNGDNGFFFPIRHMPFHTYQQWTQTYLECVERNR